MFSISESAAQDCVYHYNAQYGLNGVIFRLPPVYGYGPHTEIFKDGKPTKTGFQIFIDNAKACKPIELWEIAIKVETLFTSKMLSRPLLRLSKLKMLRDCLILHLVNGSL
ncbi:NAD-dependent epimerase/dehydratase family protein [Bdellovibrio bacteriovorus]|uniref:NAD-dependent epimerase/dehydratase family protein n=1 Tax=Bdellovibrio bacteriovorus TaxID=959 RepID=UPI0035A64E12